MVLAENTFTVTKSLFMEGQVAVLRDGYGVTVRRAIQAIAILWFILAIVTLMLEINLVFVGIEAVVLILATLWIYVVIPRSKARRAFQTFTARHGGDFSRVTRFYEEQMVIETNGGTKKISYADIEKTLYSKNLMLLIARDHTGVMLSRTGFTQGDPKAVEELIQQAKQEDDDDD